MADHAEHAHPNYEKIYIYLLVLLLISFMGPFLEIRIVTLITAFGIAIVKAYMVAKNFMHVNVEPRFVVYLMSTMLVFMLLLFAGVAPDVMKFAGTNWDKPYVSTQLRPASHTEYGESRGHGEEPADAGQH